MAKKIDTPIHLPSSKETFVKCCDYDEKTLVYLIEEAWGKNLPLDTKIIVTIRDIDYDKLSDEEVHSIEELKAAFFYFKDEITLRELHNIYEKFYHRKYTPETEKERASLKRAFMESEARSRSAWGAYAATGFSKEGQDIGNLIYIG